MDARVVGLDELAVKLGELAKVATGEQLQRALMQGGMVVERRAKQIVPVDTGKLKASIEAEPMGDDVVVVGTNTEYAADVELGNERQRAQPYLRPALDENREKIGKVIAAALRAQVEGVAG